uniref:Uncharacterized protein n=1 Tax=Anguilla anguilla TaxID=7936 RepID=A0A0E9X433_ANGAN
MNVPKLSTFTQTYRCNVSMLFCEVRHIAFQFNLIKKGVCFLGVEGWRQLMACLMYKQGELTPPKQTFASFSGIFVFQ